MADFSGSRPLLPLPASAEGARAGGLRDPLAAVGQRMEVRMIERLADGNVRLQLPASGGGSGSGDRPGVMLARLASAMSEALAARAESGQRLMAEVTRTSPSLEVRLLPVARGPGSGTGAAVPDTDRLAALLRQTLPAARALAPTLQALATAATTAATAADARTETAATRLEALVRGLPDASALTRPEGLQQATRASGVWLESMLVQSGTAGSAGTNLSGDLKARLLRAADALRQMPGAGAAPTPVSGAGPLLEGMLARLASLQLQSGGEGTDPQRWLFELPFRSPQGLQGLHGEIERHRAADDGGSEGDWRCRLTLDLPALGPTLIVLHSRAGQLHVHFTAERTETVERLQAGQATLRSNLAARDLEPASLAVRQGEVDTDPHACPERGHGMLDERA